MSDPTGRLLAGAIGAGLEPLLAGGIALQLPGHLVALKLHAATSRHRPTPEKDWEDIRQLVKLHRLDPANTLLKEIVLRYGGKPALERVSLYWDEPEGQE